MGLRVVIPVAGIGTRLRPHTHTLPKAMVHVAGRPMLGHILEELKKYDIEEVTLIIGYMGEKIQEYVTKAFGYRFRFVVQEQMKGLGHAIWLSAPGYSDADDPLLIVLGDTLFDADFNSIIGSGKDWIGVMEVEDPRRFGVVMLEGDRIKALVEKPEVPPTNLAVVGIYYFHRPGLLYQCLDEIVKNDVKTKGEYQLTDGLDLMIKRGAILQPFKVNDWLDCGKPETLLQTNRVLLSRYQERGLLATSKTHEGCVIHPPVAIHAKAKVHNSIIGPHVSLAEGATVNNAIIKDSIVSKNAHVTNTILDSSIIADNARVHGHTYHLNVGDASEIKMS